MSRYIDADKIKYHPIISDGTYSFGTRKVEGVFEVDLFAPKEEIDTIPTADVEPVRHRRWIELKNNPDFQKDYDEQKRVFYCPDCHRVETIDADRLVEYSPYEINPYCNCGAKMDKE